MKKTKKFWACVLAAATAFLPVLATPASAEARDLAVTSQENPYFGAIYQDYERPVKFKKHAKWLLQDDSCNVRLKNVTSHMSVTFRSSDTSVLTVKKLSDRSCRITGTGYGTAKVIARITTESGFFLFDDTQTVSTKFKISPRAASVRFRTKKKKIYVQSSAKLGMTIRPSISKEQPVFQTLNSRIATVSPKGVVTGMRAGKTYITATIRNGKSARCKIIVKKPKKLSGKKKNGKK